MGKMKNPMLYLGQRIKNARIAAGLTQEELAERIGVSRSAISRFELGEIEPSLRNLTALAENLQVSSDYLLGLHPCGTCHNCTAAKLSPEALAALEAFIREIKNGRENEK